MHFGKQFHSSFEVKSAFINTYDPSYVLITCLGIYPREMKTCVAPIVHKVNHESQNRMQHKGPTHQDLNGRAGRGIVIQCNFTQQKNDGIVIMQHNEP